MRAEGNQADMMSVPAGVTNGALSLGTPRRLFTARINIFTPTANYDVTADGQRFLMIQPVDGPPEAPTELVVVQNWFEELKRRLPAN